MAIRLLRETRIEGQVRTIGARLVLDPAEEADFVARGLAAYLDADPSTKAAAFAWDVVVLGATPAGVAAAVAAARLGRRVLLVSDSERLGGVMGWGITNTDVNVGVSPDAIVGFAREFLKSIGERETNSSKDWQRFVRSGALARPSWFSRAFRSVVAAEPNITVLYRATLESVSKTGTRIRSVSLRSATDRIVADARVYIDATYTGDLVAAAGCTVSIGREANATYTETVAGIRPASAWVNSVAVDPYVTPGNAASGLLFGVDSDAVGATGAADGRVMGFCYRLLVTTTAGNRTAFPAPDLSGYSAANYELLARAMAADTALGGTNYNTVAKLFQLYSLGSGGYSDVNNRGSVPASSNWLSTECKEYITATETRRAEIRENARQWLLGLFHWIANSGDSRIQSGLVADLATYGLSNEELRAYGGFSPEFYVREGRRLVGDLVMSETALSLNNGYIDPIALCYYDIDSHRVRTVVSGGYAVPEGSQLSALTTSQLGAPIPYRALLPKAAECTNLLSPTAPSVSRVVWCSIRMEPILMAMGQAAGIAAAEIVENDVDAASVSYTRLARIQDIFRVWDGIVLSTDGLYGQGTLTVTGTWATVTTASASCRLGLLGAPNLGYTTSSYRTAAAGANKLKFQPLLYTSGAYRVLFKYAPDSSGMANNATVNIVCEDAGSATAQATFVRSVNQLYPGGQGGEWEDLGVYVFRAKGAGAVSDDYVEIDATGASGTVSAVAVKWIKVTS